MNNKFNMNVAFIESGNNREASRFIGENYNEIVNQVRKMGVHPEMVHDIIADVYISINNSEENGEGYNENYQGRITTIEEFVYGRIKGYSKNAKYRTDVIQANTSGYEVERLKEERRHLANIESNSERRFKIAEIDLKIKKAEQSSYIVYAGETDTDDIDSMNSFQKAYASACTYDEIEDIENMIDIREQINYCLEFEGRVGLSVIGLLKNLDVLSAELVNKSLFDKIRDAVKYHDEFGEALKNVIEFSMNQRSAFDSVIATY